MESPLKDAFALAAADKYGLLSIVANQSEGVRSDLAAATAAQIVKDPQTFAQVLERFEESELDYRSFNLTWKAYDRLSEEHGEGKMDELTTDISFLRSLPPSDYQNPDYVTAATARLAVYQEVITTAQGSEETGQKQEKISAVLKKIEGGDIVALAYAIGIHFGDRFNDWDDTVMAHSEVKATFDVAKTIIKNWDEVGTSAKGRTYDAFVAGEGSARRVYIRRDFIDKKMQGV